mgnify:CR=1 FL=1
MKFIKLIKSKKDLLNGQDGYNLIFDKEIKENTEIFDQAIKQVLQGKTEYDYYNGNGSAASSLLCEKLITKNSKYFEPLIKKAIKNYAVELLMNKIITKNSPYYEEAIKAKDEKLPSLVRDLTNARMLLKEKIITKNHPLYEKAIKKVLQNEIDNSSLIRDGIFKNDYEINEARHKYNIRYKGYYN